MNEQTEGRSSEEEIDEAFQTIKAGGFQGEYPKCPKCGQEYFKCPECGVDPLFRNPENGETGCDNCGHKVVIESIILFRIHDASNQTKRQEGDEG